MNDTSAINASIDAALKEKAEALLTKAGLTPSQAIETLYQQIVLQQKFPLPQAHKQNTTLQHFKPELIVYDFDGVMTDNLAWVNEQGIESVAVNRSDGLGINILRANGFRQMILSTEANIVVTTRAKKLNLPVIQNCSNKHQALSDFCQKEQIDLTKVVYVGNDVNDLAAMKSVGYSICPADAHPEILTIADFVTCSKGGKGVIRELSDLLG